MHVRGAGSALAAAAMFGLGAVLAKEVGGAIDALIVAFLALALGGLLVSGWLLLRRAPLWRVLTNLSRGEWLDMLLLSSLGTALPLLLIVAGFTRTSALQGGFLLQFNGVAALLFALWLLGERIRLKQSLGILLLLLGSLLVVLKGAQGTAGWSGDLLGDLLIIAGALGLGFGFIPAKRLAAQIEPLALTAIRLLLGAAILLLPLGFQLLFASQPLHWQPTATTLWAFPVYIVTNFCLGYLAQQEGFRLLKAWEVATIMQVIPLFSTAFALLLLHDTLTLLQVGGGLLALAGGVIVALGGERTATVPEPE